MYPGKHVQQFREQRGLTVRELATLAEMRPEFLENIEAGASCHHKTLQKLADYLGVTLAMVLGEETQAPAGHNVQDEIPPEWRWILALATRLCFLLGALVLLFGFSLATTRLVLWFNEFLGGL